MLARLFLVFIHKLNATPHWPFPLRFFTVTKIIIIIITPWDLSAFYLAESSLGPSPTFFCFCMTPEQIFLPEICILASKSFEKRLNVHNQQNCSMICILEMRSSFICNSQAFVWRTEHLNTLPEEYNNLFTGEWNLVSIFLVWFSWKQRTVFYSCLSRQNQHLYFHN